MTKFLLPALLSGLLIAGSAQAQSVTVTGGNGGSVESSRDCIRGAGQATCQRNTTATTADGQTASKSRTRVTNENGTTVDRTGYGGTTTTKQRKITVNR
ncbi:hypothetical protein KM176_01645 [Pseudooceanicola sp. CBS1P-1]|uniref:Uncharacterized protein n=1 Tax=Pseudooceanicola albus TaxID=2692189 RepID=A0A6L7FZ67_9RHOB|nr:MULTISPECIES: hypothetical protein [Pseudooceanicola]MBT9382550.1 hypothetical protein [Pseudooceanicola endophyticus]MXN17091.1 hypothetical protein [Pseudooceanicola albus]